MKKRILLFLLKKVPYVFISPFMPLLQKAVTENSIYEDILMYRFAVHLSKHYDQVIRRIRKKNRVMLIQKERFPYAYAFFNICFLNDVIGSIMYALYKGYLPSVQLKSREEGENLWEWYFYQPFEQPETAEVIVCDRASSNCRPKVRTGFGTEDSDPEFKLWSFLYKKFVVFNDSVSSYIQQEVEAAGIQDNSLGLLIRGTDYTGTKPKGHPIQPEIQELIEKAAEYHEQNHYSAIYVATEEKRLFDAIADAFGREIVRENQRKYFDEQYYQRNLNYIGHVRFDRERDNFWKGLEYLSSLVILSRCTDLIAGNCGGTEFAVLFTNGYRNKYIFNKGVY